MAKKDYPYGQKKQDEDDVGINIPAIPLVVVLIVIMIIIYFIK